MTIDEYTLIADLFGKKRSETRPAESKTSTIIGVATSDSALGSVRVRLNSDLTGGEDGELVIPTEAHVQAGDVVSISLVGGTAKSPRVTGTVGGGDRTYDDAATAHEAATQAVADASQAKAAATRAASDAASAAQSASEAATSAESAESSATQAAGSATAAETSAGQAATAATEAQASAGTAATAATNAQASAGQAATAATNAQNSAGQAATSAQNAANSASAANTAANSALTQLSIVEDVAGTLDWISKHGTYTATSDTTVQEGTVYFEKDGNDYTPVIEPTGNPHSQGWYVLDVTDSQSDFIMAHLAVTSRGLWVLPSGVGSSTTPASGESQADSDARQGSGYKLLLSSNGTYIYDGSGNLVITYGANIEPSQDRPFYIGDPDSTSYILFTPASGSTPAHISIGGGVTIGSSETLSDLLDDVQVSKDICTLSITSTNGTVFKSDSGVSTTLNVRIFTGDGQVIETASALRTRYGNSAYLQWLWKDTGANDYTTLLSSDSRISRDGFSLTVTPADISTQAVINCELIY